MKYDEFYMMKVNSHGNNPSNFNFKVVTNNFILIDRDSVRVIMSVNYSSSNNLVQLPPNFQFKILPFRFGGEANLFTLILSRKNPILQ